MPATNVGKLTTPAGITRYQQACRNMEQLTRPVILPTLIEPVGSKAEGTTHLAPAISVQRPMRSVTPEPDTDGDIFREKPYDVPTEEPIGEPNEAPRQVPIEEPSTDPKGIHLDDTINTRFDLSLLQEEEVSEPHSGLSKDEQEMMLWHLRLSHLPLAILLSMARLNLLPRRLLNVKKLFCRAYAASYNVTIQLYHADNGRFADNAFRQSCQEKQQTISFCGVNAHWRNGMAEKWIRDLQDAATTSLLYAQRRWPDAIDQSLWPYALRHVNNVHNNTPLRGRKYSPLELFANVLIAPQLRHFHHFGAPAYVLNNNLQQGQRGRNGNNEQGLGYIWGNQCNTHVPSC